MLLTVILYVHATSMALETKPPISQQISSQILWNQKSLSLANLARDWQEKRVLVTVSAEAFPEKKTHTGNCMHMLHLQGKYIDSSFM